MPNNRPSDTSTSRQRKNRGTVDQPAHSGVKSAT